MLHKKCVSLFGGLLSNLYHQANENVSVKPLSLITVLNHSGIFGNNFVMFKLKMKIKLKKIVFSLGSILI